MKKHTFKDKAISLTLAVLMILQVFLDISSVSPTAMATSAEETAAEESVGEATAASANAAQSGESASETPNAGVGAGNAPAPAGSSQGTQTGAEPAADDRSNPGQQTDVPELPDAPEGYVDVNDLELEDLLGAGLTTEGDGDAPAYVLKINNQAAYNISVEYGEPLTFSLDGYSGAETVVYSYATELDAEDGRWTVISNGDCTVEPGAYRLMYGVNIGDQWISDETSFSFTVGRGTVGAPTNPHWDGSRILWTAPAVTDKGGALVGSPIMGYRVEVQHGGETEVYTVGGTAQSYDNIANNIKTDYGAAVYTFTVRALISAGDPHYASAALSGVSNGYVVPSVTLQGDSGVTSVSPDTAFVLLPGDTTYNRLAIQATVSSEYSFVSWTGNGVSFFDATAPVTEVTVNADYALGTELTVYAVTRDIVAPTITSFTGDSANGILTAAAADQQRGIAYYAFSKAPTAETVPDADWTAVAAPAPGGITPEYALTDGGEYYFYAKDVDGNVKRSASGIRVTKVTLMDYAHIDAVQDLVIYRMDDTVALPQPSCGGYNFCGWYENSDFSGTPVTTPAHSIAAPLTFYGKWEIQPLTLPTFTDVDKVYDGADNVFSVSLTNTGRLAYQWSRNGTPIPEATASSLAVKNVADSGEYVLTVKLYDDNDTQLAAVSTEAVTVSIAPRPLGVRAEDASIQYLADAPTYTYTCCKTTEEGVEVSESGLVAGEEDDITVGTLSCAYAVGDPVGEYAIVPAGFSADNYQVVHINGTLTVTARDQGVTAELTDPEAVHIYSGSEITPDVIVKDGETVLTENADYTLTYADNTNVGTARVIITLQGNYYGTETLTFDIIRASITPTLSMTGWEYGETASVPVLEGNTSGGHVTYLYTKLENSDGTLVDTPVETNIKPSDAGKYSVRALVAVTPNYESAYSNSVDFTITRRCITLTSASATFGYDGYPHSDHGYTVEGTFAPGEGFSYITVFGSHTEVTDGVPNTVSYGLNSITKPENYVITVNTGVLVITMVELTYPANAHWETANPGTASWIAVSKSGLSAQYVLQLYVKMGDSYIALGEPITTTSTQYDFSESIRTHAALGSGGSYFFTIGTEAIGSNAHNYSDSPISPKIGEIFTAVISTQKGPNVRTAQIRRNGSGDSYAESAVLLNGETASLIGTSNSGYRLNRWEPDSGLSVTGISYDSAEGLQKSTLSLGTMTASVTNATVTAYTSDMSPVVYSFTAANIANYGVEFSFRLTDGVALAGYMITNSDTYPSADDASWNPISGKSYSGTYTVPAAGDYYLYVKDSAGNVSSWESEMGVNSVTLDPGTASGTARVLLKAEGTSIQIPTTTDCGFTKVGYNFTNWVGTTGIYEQSGVYAENKNDTLTAMWTLQNFDYTVAYYYMTTAGVYPDEPNSTAQYNAIYGDVISADTEKLQRGSTGFYLDTTGDRNETITVTGDNMTLHIYYGRYRYNLKYQYRLPDAEDDTVVTVQYYYDEDLSAAFLDENKPVYAGYDFAGWYFGAAGSQPTAMPASDVTATGEFLNQKTTVHMRYYTQNLALDGYTLAADKSRELIQRHGDLMEVNPTLADVVDGFTYSVAYATYGSEAGNVIPAGAVQDFSATAVAGEPTEELYINMYYTRNTYTLTLNVWQGTVGVGSTKFTESWSFLYEASLTTSSPTATEMETYQINNWPHDDDYLLAEYADWSTGTRPDTMPAGDVTLTRQYVLKTTGAFEVEVWLEGTLDNEYMVHTFTYYANVGSTVTVGPSNTDTINYNTYANHITISNTGQSFSSYVYRTVTETEYSDGTITNESSAKRTLNGPTAISGVVTDTNNHEPTTVLRIFFERKAVPVTYSYYVLDEYGVKKLLGTAKKTRKWGSTHTYDLEVLAYFDSSTGGEWNESTDEVIMKPGTAPGGADPDAYDFRNNNFVISYSSHASSWRLVKMSTEASLTETHQTYTYYTNNTVNVYYSKTDPNNQYYLNTYYKSSNYLSHGTDVNVPLTYTLGEGSDATEYEVRIANEAYFYQDAQYVPDSYPTYPGLGYYNNGNTLPNQTGSTGRYIYTVDDSNLKPGYTRVTINGKTYFTDATHIYVPVTDNRFFYGNTVSYKILSTDIGYSSATDFLAQYKIDYATDPYAVNSYIWTTYIDPTIFYGNGSVPITFHNGETCRITYNMSGTVCKNDGHLYPEGSSVTSVGCSHGIFLNNIGFHIVWYRDTAYTQPVTLPFRINTDIMLYGRYEKNTVNSFEYAYYELADHVFIGDTEYAYITETDLPAFASDPLLTQETIGDKTIWSYKGARVMARRPIVSLSFTEVSMNLADYAMSGLLYDTTNANNNVVGYVEAVPIALRCFFCRETYTVTANSAIPNANDDIIPTRNGETLTIAAPVRDGYLFAGWVLKDEEGNPVPESRITRHTDNSVTLNCPGYNVLATGTWTPTDYHQEYIHYYQNPSLSYDTEEVTAMLAETGTAATLKLNGTSISGLVYSNGGASYEADGKTYYYSRTTGTDNTLDAEYLAAIYQYVDVLQEGDTAVLSKTIPADKYHFAYAIRKFDGTVTELTADDSYVNEYGMVIEYYYALDTGYSITLSSHDMRGTSPVMTLYGDGTNYYYSEVASVSASATAGYDFLGWYDAESYLDADDNLVASALITTGLTFQTTVKKNLEYVAVVNARPIADPVFQLTGITELSYGYPSSKENAVTVLVSFPEDADDANYVKSYQWNMVDASGNKTPVAEGGNSATLLIPVGWQAGTYTLCCDVTVSRDDNYLEKTYTTANYTIQVNASDMSVDASNYSGIYDGATHSISVEVLDPYSDSDYEIYYADHELTADNYTTAGTNAPAYKDVGTYQTWYYIKSLNPNFVDCVGSRKVTITPKRLTLNAGSVIYSKTYNGSNIVGGSVTEVDSDLYRLCHDQNVYSIVGLQGTDSIDDNVINCDAEFNSSHVSEANVVSLTNLSLVSRSDGTVNNNYYFDPDYSIAISAYINRMLLDLEWSNTDLDYNATEQCPTCTIVTALPEPDDGKLYVTVAGGQTNSGTFSASAVLASTDENTKGSDFSVKNGAADFTIHQIPITISPVEEAPVVYDGRSHVLSAFAVTEGALAANQRIVASCVSGAIEAGENTITAANASVYDLNGIDVTDNYNISYDSVILTILPRTVTVSNLLSSDKVYDANTTATVNCAMAVFPELVTGDDLRLDSSKVTAQFADAAVGADKTVTFTLADGVLAGADANNYVLDRANSTLTTTNSITQAEITVSVNDVTTVYGENVSFTCSYAGFLGDDDASVIIADSANPVVYTIGTAEDTAVPYTVTTSVGTYNIYADISGLNARDYSLRVVNGELTVNQRPITVAAASEADIRRSYNGNVSATVLPSCYVFAPVTGNSASGIVNSDAVTLGYTAAYNSKNVDEAVQVNMTGLSIDNGNYSLLTTDFTIPGSITPVTLTVTADNKNLTYGATAAPEYTDTIRGYVVGEGIGVLVTENVVHPCVYDPADPDNRDSGSYTIPVSGYQAQHGNYVFTYNAGTLQVKKAEITIAAVADDTDVTYGMDPIPAMSFSYTPLAYSDDFSTVVSGSVTYDYGRLTESSIVDDDGVNKNVITSIPGSYPINPVISGLSADNYTFKAQSVTIVVNKYTLSISGIVIRPRVYNGTTTVNNNQIDLTNVYADGLLKVDRDYFNEHKYEILSISGDYADKNVGTGKAISLRVAFLTYLKDRCYVNTNSQSTATGDITTRPLQVTAGDLTVLYGLPTPAFTVSFGKTTEEGTTVADSGLVSGETLTVSNVTFTTTHSCTPGAWSPVGEYSVTPTAVSDSATAAITNYAPVYVPGKLTVTQNQLAVPSVAWTAVPGVISWGSVPGVGDVTVNSYEASLYKDGVAVTGDGATVTVSASDPLEHDFSAKIHATGSGAYTVHVRAIASIVNNADKVNVADSNPGNCSFLYAADVSFVFSDDVITQTGKGSSITIHGENTYPVIAGEQSVPIAATLLNPTGYTVESVTSSSAVLTVGGGTEANRSGTQYTDTVSMAATLNSSAPITVTLKLFAKDAKFVVLVTPRPGASQARTTYGYGESGRPELLASVEPTDKTTTYHYSYVWHLKYAGTSITYEAVESTDTTCTWKFPLSMKANVNPDYYQVCCVVTATRDDNGMSYTNALAWNATKYAYVTSVSVDRATFTAAVSITGWMYGETRNAPSLIDINVTDNEMANNESCTFWYKLKSDEDIEANWHTLLPTDAGTYLVKAYIPTSVNYEEFWTLPVEFTIAKNKLATPTGLTMTPSTTAPYGNISWSAVSGVEENNNVTPASTVTVTYQVRLYDKSDDSLVREYDPISGLEMDITNDLQVSRSYYFTVQAISSNVNNCENSDISARFVIFMDGSITAVDTRDGSDFTGTKLYDGYAVRMTVAIADVVSYQWYEGTQAIPGATGVTLDVTHVSESGVYTCLAPTDDGNVYTPKYFVTITRRGVTMTSATDTKQFDGAALTNSTVTVTGDGFARSEGAAYDVTGTITNVGSCNNTFTYALNSDTTADDYTIATPVFGTLSITKRPIVDTGTEYTYGTVSNVIYRDAAFTPTPSVTDNGLDAGVGARVLVADTDYSYSYQNNLNVGTATVTITGRNNYTGSVSFDFEIARRPIVFIGETKTVAYNGALQKTAVIDICADTAGTAAGEDSGLVTGHTHNVTYLAQGTEASDTPYAGVITAAGSVVIRNATADVTANYSIDTVAGGLKIDRTTADWSIALASKTYNYDQNEHANPNTPTDTALTGTTTYEYSFTKSSGYTSDLSSLKQTDAGDYTIYIRAVNPNYTQTPTATSHLIINRISPNLTVSDQEKVYGDAAFNLNATNTSTDADKSVSYSSADTNVVTVSDDGTVTIVNAGTTTITVSMPQTTNYLAQSRTINITVKPRPVEFTWSVAAFVYDKSEKTVTATVSNYAYDDSAADFTISYADNATNVNHATAVGNYTAIVNGIGNTNYTLLKNATENVDTISKPWTITYLGTDAVATLSGTLGSNGWYVSDVLVVAPAGYTISLTESDFAASLPYSADGSYTVNYKLKDNTTDQITDYKSISFKIDQTRPTGAITLEGTRSFSGTVSDIVYQYIYLDDADATITANDGTGKTVGVNFSGIDTIEYMVVDEGETYNPAGTWTSYAAFTLSANKKTVVYARITDKAGNQQIINTDGLVIYTNATPTDTITYIRATEDDMESAIAFNGNTVRSVWCGTDELDTTAYSVSGGKLTLLGSWLETLDPGTYTVTVNWYPLGVTETTTGTQPTSSVITLKVVLHERSISINTVDDVVVDANAKVVNKTYNKVPVNSAAYTISVSDSATHTPLPEYEQGTITRYYKLVADAHGTAVTDSAETTAAPILAGTYEVRIAVGATEHYAAATSAVKTIAISRKTINIVDVTAQDRAFDNTNSVEILSTGHLDAVESGDVVTFTQPTVGTMTDPHPGTGKSVTLTDPPTTISGADADNYILGTINAVTVNISKATGVVTITSMADKTYDGVAAEEPVYTVVGTGPITIEYKQKNAADDTYSTVKPIVAGSYTVRVSMAADQDYTAAYDTADFTIEQRTVTLNWSDKSLTYTGSAQLPTLTLGNIVSGETVTATVTGSQTAVGSYTATVTALSSANYKLPDDVNCAFAITPKAVTITVDDASKTYGETDPAFTLTVAGLVDDSDLGTVTAYRSNAIVENAGTYADVLTASYTANANYAVTIKKGKFIINRSNALSLTTSSYSGTYDGAAHSVNPTASVTEGTTISYSVTSGVWSTTVPTITNAGTVTVSVKAENDNYVTATGSYTLTVSPKEYSVTTYSKTAEYTGVPLTAGGEIVGLVEGETAELVMLGSITSVGKTNNTYTINWNGTALQSNYVHGTDTIGVLEVIPNSSGLVVTGIDYSGTYDAMSHGQAAAVSIELDTTISYSLDNGVTWQSAFPQVKNVEKLTVKVKAENVFYETAYDTYTLEVKKAKYSITTNSASREYNGSALTATGAVTGLVNGETVNFTVTGTITNVGTTTNTYTLAWTGTASQSNYELDTETLGTLEVKKNSTDLTVAGTDYSDSYDGVAHGDAATATVSDATVSYSIDSGATWSTAAPQITNVGRVDVMVKAEHSNYVTATDSYSLQVQAAEYTVTTQSASREYNGSALTAGGRIDGLVHGETAQLITTGTITDCGSTTNTYTITWGTTDNNNYKLASESLGTLTVTPNTTDLTISNTSYSDVYDGQTHGIAATASITEGTTVSYQVNGGAWSTTVPTITNVGLQTIHVKAEKDNYATATCSYSLQVSERPYTVTTYSDTKTYDGTPLTAGGEITGLVEGETVTFTLTGTITNAGETDNTYTITWNGTAKSGNYTLDSESIGRLHIDLASAGFTVSNAGYTGVYDGQTHGVPAVAAIPENTTVSYQINGGVWTSAAPTVTDVEKLTVNVKAENPNYVTANCSYVLEVTAKTWTVTTASASRMYDGTPLTAGGSIVGLVEGETVDFAVTGTITDAGETDNTYSLAWTGSAKQSNYVHGTDSIGKLEVTQSTTGLTVDGTSYTGTYDAQTHGVPAVPSITAGTTVYYSVDGKKSWSTTYPTVNGAAVVNVDVRADNNNYVSAYTSYTLTVSPKPVTITVDNKQKLEGDADPEFTGLVEGLINESDLDPVTYSRTNTDESKGKYPGVITVTYTANPNYAVTVYPGNLTIMGSDTLWIFTNDLTVTYDGKPHTAAPTVSIKQDTTISYSLDNGVNYQSELPTLTDAGTMKIRVRAQNPYYEDAFADFRITVKPAELQITADAAGKTYGDNDPAILTATVTGMVSGEDPDALLRYTVTRAAGETAGEYMITVSGSASQGNYHISWASGTFTIAKRPLGISWSLESVEYNGTLRTITATLENVAAPAGTTDDVTIDGFDGTISATNAGKYDVSVTDIVGADIDNYILPSLNYTWEITAKSLADSATPTGYANGILLSDIPAITYDGQAQTPHLEIVDSLIDPNNALTADTDYTIRYVDNKNAGTASITITGLGNYKDTITKEFVIDPIVLSLRWTRDTFTYDGKGKVIDAKILNAVAGDDVTVKDYQYNITVKAGQFTAVAFSLGGANASNYTLEGCTTATHLWNVYKADVSIKADSKESMVGETLEELTYQITDGELFGDDTLGNIVLRSEASDKAGVYPIVLTIEDQNPNYNVRIENGTYKLKADPTAAQPPRESEPTEGDNGQQTIEPNQTTADGIPCYWHWIIVLECVLYALALLLTMKRRKDEPEEETEKRRKKSRRIRIIAYAVFIASLVLLNVLGFCHLELPLSLVSAVLIAVMSLFTYRYRFAADESERTEEATR